MRKETILVLEGVLPPRTELEKIIYFLGKPRIRTDIKKKQ
jgi:hypothetical protein